MTRGWLWLGGLVLVASAVPLTQAELDRAAAPRGTMAFSHRELTAGWSREENSGVTVQWNWAVQPTIDSLTRPQLDSLGLRCPGTGYDCESRSGTRGWMVVGLDTVAWQRAVDSSHRSLDSIGVPVKGDTAAIQRRRDAISRLSQLEEYTSRLRMVAVGRDPERLAAAWSDGRHLVLPAKLWVYRETYPREDRPGELALFSVRADPLPSQLFVPVEWAGMVTDTSGLRDRRYVVTVAVGARWLTRVVRVERGVDPRIPAE